MRLFDKCVGGINGRRFPAIDAFAEKYTVVAADAVAAFAQGQDFSDVVTTTSFPGSRPPWEWSFVEWNCQGFVGDGGKSYVEHGLQQFGFSCVANPTVQDRKDLRQFIDGLNSGGDWSFIDSASEVVELTPVACIDGTAKEYGWICVVAWNDENDITACRWCRLERGKETFRAAIYLMPFLYVLFNTFMFSNCCNVKLQDVTERLAPPPKIRRRLKIPEVKRYTLNIEGHYTTPSRNFNEPQVGIMPFHLCRGHFATYTAEHPRFGRLKDGVGRFWIPPHVKGKKENGEVIKDYAITAPAFSEAQS